MRLLLGLLLAAALNLELGAVQALQCHQCKGFGGCSHKSRCPAGSSRCITIATHE
ncbi:secreted Ly-6/uPAR domain-containing protein 2 [Mesoplodon densirostris]|uniref:secreted Ly-6/uPAR domain-containing protein 2 n=1 Tax=Mesoplodon densirostris TaxID=48708 RepID=UPI0028DB05AC|nr:secreted Ly-6/uPAR domain-containing protein 2 [Mesoplodon densirostris]